MEGGGTFGVKSVVYSMFSFIKLLSIIRLEHFQMSLCFSSYLTSKNIVLRLDQFPYVLLVAKNLFLSILVNPNTQKIVGVNYAFFTTLSQGQTAVSGKEFNLSTVPQMVEHLYTTGLSPYENGYENAYTILAYQLQKPFIQNY